MEDCFIDQSAVVRVRKLLLWPAVCMAWLTVQCNNELYQLEVDVGMLNTVKNY